MAGSVLTRSASGFLRIARARSESVQASAKSQVSLFKAAHALRLVDVARILRISSTPPSVPPQPDKVNAPYHRWAMEKR